MYLAECKKRRGKKIEKKCILEHFPSTYIRRKKFLPFHSVFPPFPFFMTNTALGRNWTSSFDLVHTASPSELNVWMTKVIIPSISKPPTPITSFTETRDRFGFPTSVRCSSTHVHFKWLPFILFKFAVLFVVSLLLKLAIMQHIISIIGNWWLFYTRHPSTKLPSHGEECLSFDQREKGNLRFKHFNKFNTSVPLPSSFSSPFIMSSNNIIYIFCVRVWI